MTFVDRSRVISYRQCPRQRYLAYHHMGHGIRTGRLAIPLATGTYVHQGLEQLLSGRLVDDAVAHAVRAYQADAATALGTLNVHADRHDYTIAEQSALVEGLVRVYAIQQLPALQAEYDVVEVEQEYTFPMDDGMTWMTRVDGLLRKRSDGEIYVLSFKTDKGTAIDKKLADARIDLQGLTEPIAVERAMQQWRPDRYNIKVPFTGPPWAMEWIDSHSLNEPFRVAGVKMEWLIKGAWDDEGQGKRVQDSFLVRPWTRGIGATREFAWSYYYPCPGHAHTIVGANGRPWKCAGDVKNHGLGSSWTRCNIWELMPMKEWVDMLASGEVYPQLEGVSPLQKLLYCPVPIYRNERDQAARWQGVESQEFQIEDKLERLKDDPLPLALNEDWPKYDHSCNHSFGGPCQFNPLCWATNEEEALADALNLGFEPRQPHHEAELVQIKGLNTSIPKL